MSFSFSPPFFQKNSFSYHREGRKLPVWCWPPSTVRGVLFSSIGEGTRLYQSGGKGGNPMSRKKGGDRAVGGLRGGDEGRSFHLPEKRRGFSAREGEEASPPVSSLKGKQKRVFVDVWGWESASM